ncbi:MAG: proton-conducting transporter membrane subunit [Caldilineales bacterium]
MSGAVLVLTLPLLAAVLVYLLRRWPTPSTLLAGVAALTVGVLMWRWPNDDLALFLGRVIRPNTPLELLGQTLVITPAVQWAIGFMAITLAGAYLGAWRVSPGRSFYPFGLALLALFSAVLMLDTVALQPLLLVSVLCLAVFVIQAGRQGSTRGALRVLWLPTLAVPLFLIAAWYFGQAVVDPGDPFLVQRAARLTSWGLLLLLAPWPLHGPALSVGEEAPPLVGAWLLTVLAVVNITMLQEFLVSFESLQGISLFADFPFLRLAELLVLGGIALSLWSGVAGALENDLSRLWSYAALFSYGAILVALGLGAESSWALVWLLMITRTVGLMVSGYGRAVIRQRAGSVTDFDHVQGHGTRLPWTSTAFLLGVLSLAGLPLTIGFASQWAMMQVLGNRDWLQAVVILAGAVGLIVGVMRSVRVLLGPLENRLLERENRVLIILAVAGVLVVLLPALRPQIWRPILTAAVAAFTSTPG